MTSSSGNAGYDQLARVVGVPGAVLMGLGSILGTGIFVSVGIAAGVAGPSLILAIVLAAVVATFNGLSSAQLAASHPVSGGTYEYGYRYLNPTLGFTAGWMFLCAKSASAATAALGLAGYLLTAAVGSAGATQRIVLGAVVTAGLTALVAGGMSRSYRTNAVIVSLTIGVLVAFVLAGAPTAIGRGGARLAPFFASESNGFAALLHGTALMFVAYTGYGRIATLGEEIRDPQSNIPRAIVIALIAAMLLYTAVGAVAVATLGANGLAEAARSSSAPLEIAATQFSWPLPSWLIALGAVTAMTGVLLNLLLGLSRVILAMARRADVPRSLAELDCRHGSPRRAVVVTGVLIAALVLVGDVKTTWSFSAFTVLVYYAITNLAALRLPPPQRRFPRAVPLLGLASCLGLAFFVEARIWATGLALIAAGWLWHRVARRLPETGGGG